jgi:hypothetical protein
MLELNILLTGRLSRTPASFPDFGLGRREDQEGPRWSWAGNQRGNSSENCFCLESRLKFNVPEFVGWG